MPHCLLGYTPPAGLDPTDAAPQPASGGVFYSLEELSRWRERVVIGPFVTADDFMPGSPADWGRVSVHANAFMSIGEVSFTAGSDARELGTLGIQARDAAFSALIRDDAKARSAVVAYLLEQADNPALDLPSTECLKYPDGRVLDGLFFHGAWLLRYIVSYDYVRAALAPKQRVRIERFIRHNAYFLAVMSDKGLADVFPLRLSGNYQARRGAAKPASESETWWTKRYDTTGDCRVDASDEVAALPVYAYVRADGSLGPRLSVLSQYYNNRRSIATAAFGAAGVLLADPVLVGSAKRYFMEWLAYSVYPDGSLGEYARNGDYCIPGQGAIYGSADLQGAALLASLLARQGDRSLVEFSTREGLFGSESRGNAAPKSIALAINTYIELIRGRRVWFFHQPWRARQDLSAANAIGSREVHYMGSPQAMDEYHELGLLPHAGLFPAVPIAGTVLRDRQVFDARFPGATGHPVATGYGNWSDYFNALPAALLLRP
ncbi:MAG: hypothetical protein JO006_11415 [Paucibacter sp.]|nr:hypothetical protein [Roseateles sp.]